MKGSQSGVNKLGDFFRAEDDGQTLNLLGVRSLGDTPRLPQRLDVEESQSGEPLRHSAGCQLSLAE